MPSPFSIEKSSKNAHLRTNITHSLMLLAGIGAILAIATFLVWGPAGIGVTALTLAFMFLLAPRLPPQAVMRLYRATLVPRDATQLSSLVDVLAFRAGLPYRPVLYVVPTMALNAFAAGSPRKSAIALTEGILRRLSLREIAGVLAHEMSHIKHNDLWLMSLADMVTRFLQVLSYVALALAIYNVFAAFSGDFPVPWSVVLLLYIAPAISSLLQLGFSRAREFEADAEAARLTGDPEGFAAALKHLESHTGHFWEDLMFPVPGRRVPLPSLLRTHPETSERIDRLLSRDVKDGETHEPLVFVEEPMTSLVGVGPIAMRPRYRFPGLWY